MLYWTLLNKYWTIEKSIGGWLRNGELTEENLLDTKYNGLGG